MLGGALLGGSTVDLYQLKGNIDQVQHPSSSTSDCTVLAFRAAAAKCQPALHCAAATV